MAEFSWNGHPLDSLLYRLGSGTATREDQSQAYSELKAATEEAHRLREQLRVAREGLGAIEQRQSWAGIWTVGEDQTTSFKRLQECYTVARDTLARIDAKETT